VDDDGGGGHCCATDRVYRRVLVIHTETGSVNIRLNDITSFLYNLYNTKISFGLSLHVIVDHTHYVRLADVKKKHVHYLPVELKRIWARENIELHTGAREKNSFLFV